ncbi:MAG: hypothetical protein ABL940_07370 [Bacteroidia bacterium]
MSISNTLLITALLSVCSFTTLAQKSEGKRILKLKLCSFSAQGGAIIESNVNETPTDFKQLAPQSVVLNVASTRHYLTNTGYTSFGSGTFLGNNLFTVSASFKFGNKQKTEYRKGMLLRVGINYFSETNLSATFYTKETTVYDTLIAANATSAVYLDSVSRKYYNMNYASKQLRLDAALLLRTDPYERWSLYTGIGVNGGVSVNAQTTINYHEYEELETRYQSGANYTSPLTNKEKIEKHTNQNNIVTSAYIPLGADFRIGNTHHFWTRAHLFYELRPSFNVTYIPELRTIANFSFQHGIGFRYSL